MDYSSSTALRNFAQLPLFHDAVSNSKQWYGQTTINRLSKHFACLLVLSTYPLWTNLAPGFNLQREKEKLSDYVFANLQFLENYVYVSSSGTIVVISFYQIAEEFYLINQTIVAFRTFQFNDQLIAYNLL